MAGSTGSRAAMSRTNGKGRRRRTRWTLRAVVAPVHETGRGVPTERREPEHPVPALAVAGGRGAVVDDAEAGGSDAGGVGHVVAAPLGEVLALPVAGPPARVTAVPAADVQ